MTATTSPTVVELSGDYTHRMLHTRGIRLHAVEAGRHADPLVVLIHGAFGAWLDFKDVVAPLAQRGFHVVALDARGYGMSDKPAPRAGDLLHLLAGDTAGAIRTLGYTGAALVGSDTGAVIARATASLYPTLVTDLIVLPQSAGRAARAFRLPARLPAKVAGASNHALDAIWRANLLANTTGTFHGTDRFEEFLRLRIAARDIDNALPHIAATSRLRSRRLPATPGLGPGNLPHIEAPETFVNGVAHALDAGDN